MTTAINNLYQTAQNSGNIITLLDIIMMFATAIFSLLATVIAFFYGISKVGIQGLKHNGEINAKYLFLLSVVPFLYMALGAIFYQLIEIIINTVYAHSSGSSLNLFTFNPENYNLTRFTNHVNNFSQFLLNSRDFIKTAILILTTVVYFIIFIFYAGVAIDAMLAKTQVTIFFNIVTSFFILLVGVVVAHTYDTLTSATLFKNGILLHGTTSHSISQFLHNQLIFYAKYYFTNLN